MPKLKFYVDSFYPYYGLVHSDSSMADCEINLTRAQAKLVKEVDEKVRKVQKMLHAARLNQQSSK